MILPTMTYAEIANELDKDAKSLYGYIEYILSDNKYRRIGMKHSEPICFKPVFWESKRKNQYFIIPNTNGKKDLKKYGLAFYVWCYYTDAKNKKNGVMILSNGTYSFFRGHLFDRYAERFFDNTSMTTVDLMVKFASNNSFIVSRPFSTAFKYKNSYFAVVNDGAILGTYTNGYFVYNTFITEEMMKGSEIDYNEIGKNELKECIEWRKNKEYVKFKMIEKMHMETMRMAS